MFSPYNNIFKTCFFLVLSLIRGHQRSMHWPFAQKEIPRWNGRTSRNNFLTLWKVVIAISWDLAGIWHVLWISTFLLDLETCIFSTALFLILFGDSPKHKISTIRFSNVSGLFRSANLSSCCVLLFMLCTGSVTLTARNNKYVCVSNILPTFSRMVRRNISLNFLRKFGCLIWQKHLPWLQTKPVLDVFLMI